METPQWVRQAGKYETYKLRINGRTATLSHDECGWDLMVTDQVSSISQTCPFLFNSWVESQQQGMQVADSFLRPKLDLSAIEVGKQFEGNDGSTYQIIRWDEDTLAVVDLTTYKIDAKSLEWAVELRLAELCGHNYNFSSLVSAYV